MLGEAQSKCQHIAGVPLTPDAAERLYELYLAKGVHATTSIEGNTLSEDQVKQQIEGKLKLPRSQEYMATEVQNIAWIHPFRDGNGRKARLIEFFLLVQSGIPLPACHLLSNHYNKTRTRYYAELDRSSKAADGDISFISYAVSGFVDGLREQLEYIRDQQWLITWKNYVHEKFRDKPTRAHTRQRLLVLDLPLTPTARKGLTHVSPRVAEQYAGKGDKTLSRDINALMAMDLLVKETAGYLPNRDRFSHSCLAGLMKRDGDENRSDHNSVVAPVDHRADLSSFRPDTVSSTRTSSMELPVGIALVCRWSCPKVETWTIRSTGLIDATGFAYQEKVADCGDGLDRDRLISDKPTPIR